MPAQIGGNKLAGAETTFSPTPNSSYSGRKLYVLDESLSDWDQSSSYAVSGARLTNRLFYQQDVGWNVGAAGTASIEFDLGEARGGDAFFADGYYGDSLIYRPTGIKLEHSDDGSAWTTVDDLTGLTGGGQPGPRSWLYKGDISGEGDHRYWRLTLTSGGNWVFLDSVDLR
jgi:hypothetical protein